MPLQTEGAIFMLYKRRKSACGLANALSRKNKSDMRINKIKLSKPTFRDISTNHIKEDDKIDIFNYYTTF